MEDTIRELLPFLIPFIAISMGLLIAALVHIFKAKSYRVGSRVLWVLISFLGIIGPVLYFVIGRSEGGGD